ncbi:MAG TPA: hypothetical protein VF529_12225 [Solirubrobacteraceae bacterium]
MEAGEAGGTADKLVELALRFAAALAAAVVAVGFVAFVGGVILWSRFEAAQLPADQAVAVQSRRDLVTAGAIALVLFVLGGLVSVLVLRLLDSGGTASLRTRRGLLVVILLEVTAAFVVEDWEPREWVPLSALALAALVAIAVLLEQAAYWNRDHPVNPLGALGDRARAVFFTGVLEVRRLRLWAGIVVLVASVVALAVVDPERDAYALGLVLVLAGAALSVAGTAKGPARSWGIVATAVGVGAFAFVAVGRESKWVAGVAGIALALGLVNLAIAHVTGNQFRWYGVTVFLTIVLFGAAFNFARALEDPQAQGVALLRTNDAHPVCGLYVGENDGRLYYARIDLRGTAQGRELANDSGRLLWAPTDRLVASAIGPLEPVMDAQDRALTLRDELALNREPLTQGGAAATSVPPRPPRDPGGRDPCKAATTPASQLLTPERRLAQRFQPRLHVSSNDGFWPVSLLTIFDLKQRGKSLCRRPPCVPVLSAGDLPYRGGETEWLDYPGDFDKADHQHNQMVQALGSSDPYRTAREYFLLSDPGAGQIASLQYWFFYTFNYQPLAAAEIPVGRAGYHEGDFEHVGVVLSATRTPVALWMARHDGGEPFLWDEPALARNGSHVDVHVARGSHASYESCLEQRRRRAPFGLINDRPECRTTRQIVLEPTQVPVQNLAQARWACWAGRFGHTRLGESRLEFELYEANGPRSPLWQQDYDGKARPCDAVESPEPLPAEGEEPLGADVANRIAGNAGRIERAIDECGEWQHPQSQGAYVVACHQPGLTSWVAKGLDAFDGPPLRVLTPREPATRGAARPIAVRRAADVVSFDGWRVRSEAAARIDVYASCLVGRRPVEATFSGVRIGAGEELRLDARIGGRWRLLRGAAEQAASAAPVLAPEAKSGPNAERTSPGIDTVCR